MVNKTNVGSLEEKVSQINKAYKNLCKSEECTIENQYIIGDNLRQIKEGGLFKGNGVRKFEDFCKSKFKFSKQYAYMLINASIVQNKLEEKGVLQIKCPEKILRLLTAKKYKEGEIMKDIWSKATQNNPRHIPTRTEIAVAKREVLPPVPTDGKDKTHETVLKTIKQWLNDKNISHQIKELLDELNKQLSNELKNNNN